MKAIIILAALIFSLKGTAQSKEDFENFGHLVFQKLIEEPVYNDISFIWLNEYRSFIDGQNISDYEKGVLKREMDARYSDLYNKYQQSYQYFKTAYNTAREKGTGFEYIGTYYTPLEELDRAYHFEISFIYKSEDVQNEVVISFDAAWYVDHFSLISDFKENF